MNEEPGTVRWGVLGSFEVQVNGRPVDVGGPRRQTTLALLVASAGRVVSLDALIEGLWGERIPGDAGRTVRTYMSRLRAVLPTTAGQIVTRPPGYLLLTPPESVDAGRFERLATEGSRALELGQPQLAAVRLTEALALWRGEAYGEFTGTPDLAAESARLTRLRLTALQDRIEADLATGGGRYGLVPELERLVEQHPEHERLWGQLMRVLYRDGRQSEALAAYGRARRILIEQSGVEPSPALTGLQHQILTQDDRLLVRPAADPHPPLEIRSGAPAPLRSTAVPAQLPADVPTFIGRQEELAALDRLLDRTLRADDQAGEPLRAVLISAVSGTAGVGKTALAVRWGHQVRRHFPDGQLYLDLRGYGPAEAVSAGEALSAILTALGVAGPGIPLELDARAAAYRSRTAGRRILIVLDNAAGAEQVRPLLPGTSSCLVVVTSRDALTGLVVRDGAERLELDLLPMPEALALLRALIGDRVAAEPAAALALAAQCARLPLALRVAAELAAARSGLPLAELVAELTDHRHRLDLLDDVDDDRTAVRSVFSWSYDRLPADAARTFRLVSLHPGLDLDHSAVAALTGRTHQHARSMLQILVRAHLIQPVGPDRYRQHDLLRAYAAELVVAQDPRESQRQALTKLFDYYVAAVGRAMDRLHPAETHRRPVVPSTGASPPWLPDADSARAWLDAERSGLVRVAEHAATHGWPDQAVRLSGLLFRYLVTGHHAEALALHGHARTAALRTGDRRGQALALHGLGTGYLQMGRYAPAADMFERALALFRLTGDIVGQARARGNLGVVAERLARHQAAAAHFEAALELFRQIGDLVGEARALTCLGDVEERLGRYGPANDHLEQGLALSRRVGDEAGEADALNNLGVVEVRLGRYGPAGEHLDRALELFRRRNDRTGEAWVLNSLGALHTHQNRPDQAVEHHRRALAQFREIGERDGEGWALNGLGEAANTAGRPTEALEHHTTAHAVTLDTGMLDQQARAHLGLAQAHHALDDRDRARVHYEQALALHAGLGIPGSDRIRALIADVLPPSRTGFLTTGASVRTAR